MARRRSWVGQAAYAVGAVLVCLALVVGCVSGGDDGSDRGGDSDRTAGPDGSASPSSTPRPLSGDVAWQTDPPSGGGLTTLSGWVNDRVVVSAAEEEVTAVDRRTGKQAWKLKPPRPRTWPKQTSGREFCGASTRVVEGQAALTYGQEDADGVFRCVGLRLVDLDTGRTVWDEPLARAHDKAVLFMSNQAHVELSGDTVLVAESDRFHALHREDGSELWADLPEDRGESCSPFDLLPAGGGFVTLESCTSGPVQWRLRRVDGEDGAPRQNAQIKRNQFDGQLAFGAGLVAGDPLTVLLQGKADGSVPQRLVSWPKRGGDPTVIASRVGGPDAFDGQPLSIGSGHPRYRMLVGSGVIVVPTGDWVKQRNELVAFDLDTGQRRWSVPSGSAGALAPVGIDADTVIAVAANSRKRSAPAQVVRIDLKDGDRQPVLSSYDDYGVRIGIRRGLLRWYDGRIYGVPFSPIPPTPTAFALR